MPSIVYGVLGLALFVRFADWGRSILSGSLTMALLILPVIVIASTEAIRAVPSTLREAGLALGATRWQLVWGQVLPAALPGIMTGNILALSRAVGETAPLIMIGALSYVAFIPSSIWDSFTVVPVQIFNWAARPQPEFHIVAAGAILVVLIVLLSLNALAIIIRQRFQRYRL
jgi:phosphate transport system permease protein